MTFSKVINDWNRAMALKIAGFHFVIEGTGDSNTLSLKIRLKQCHRLFQRTEDTPSSCGQNKDTHKNVFFHLSPCGCPGHSCVSKNRTFTFALSAGLGWFSVILPEGKMLGLLLKHLTGISAAMFHA